MPVFTILFQTFDLLTQLHIVHPICLRRTVLRVIPEMAVHIDVLSDFLHAIGFVHLPGLAVPEYIESEIVQDETPMVSTLTPSSVTPTSMLPPSSYFNLIIKHWQGK